MRRALLLAPLLLSLDVLAAGRTLPVPDASFDSGPGGWTLEGQNASPRIDGPRKSLLLESAVPARLTAVSGEVTLQVGQAYRLSAVIRTENVRSDETARYPTAASACLSMESFPFTNHSAAVGATRDFTKVETIFLATTAKDRVRLHLGKNGDATGKAWFDDVVLEELDDISALVPKESVRWSGEGYRYDDRGWIFVHVE
ncbi:MAG: hypothetical protein JNK60_02340, partial [Acidobacteria bacterium]|nr:hypothetical protein [Acidobacteriota bacterium]